MDVTCPHCAGVNRVAGYYARRYGEARPDGDPVKRDTLYCGLCGQPFPDPGEAGEAVPVPLRPPGS